MYKVIAVLMFFAFPANAGSNLLKLSIFCETLEGINSVVDWNVATEDCRSLAHKDVHERAAELLDIIDSRRDFNGNSVDIGKVKLMDGTIGYSVGRGLEV